MLRTLNRTLDYLRASLVAGVFFCVIAHGADRKRIITLEDAYDRSLASDQTIRIAWLESAKADLLPISALTRLGPQISAKFAYDPASQTTRGSAGSTGLTGTTNVIGSGNRRITTHTDVRRAGVVYQQTLLDFTVFPAFRLGKLSEEAAKLEYQRIVRETLFGVARAFYNVLKNQRIVEVGELTLATSQQQLDEVDAHVRAGDATPVEVARAKATFEDTRKTLIESKAFLELARNVLANLLNLPVGESFGITEPSPAQFEEETFESALAGAYGLREDFKVSEIAIKQDIERRNEIKGQYGPRIVADLSQNWDAYKGSDRNLSNWNASLALQIPIFTGGQREIDLKSSRYQIDQSRLQHEKVGKSIEEEVKTAWVGVRTLRETIKSVEASVEAAQVTYDSVMKSKDAGAVTSLAVQIATRDLFNARTTLATQKYDYQIALRDLQRSQAAFQTARVSRAAAMLVQAAKKQSLR